MAACPQCGGPFTLIAAIEDPAVIIKMLSHLGLPTHALPRSPARIDEFLQPAEAVARLLFIPEKDGAKIPWKEVKGIA
jgi:hypothetical protein